MYLVGSPYQRGFNCDDDSIRYPYKDNTISSGLCYTYSTLIPLITIIFNEFFIVRARTSKASLNDSNSNLSDRDFIILVVWNVYAQVAPLLFTVGASQLITDIAKYSIGRLRPHFIDLCQPRAFATNEIITRQSLCYNPHAYITDFECTNMRFAGNAKLLRDVRLSFMSGHSSFVAVCLVYLVVSVCVCVRLVGWFVYIAKAYFIFQLYIQMRVRVPVLLRGLTQTLLVSLVVYTGFTRISDYKHHWSDVLTGLAQGTLVAIVGAIYVSDLYRPRNYFAVRRAPPTTVRKQIDNQSNV